MEMQILYYEIYLRNSYMMLNNGQSTFMNEWINFKYAEKT